MKTFPHITKGEALERAKELWDDGYRLMKEKNGRKFTWRAVDSSRPVLPDHVSAKLSISRGSAAVVVRMLNAWSMGTVALGSYTDFSQ